MMETFEEWFKRRVDTGASFINRYGQQEAWDHQQKNIDKLIANGYICPGAKGTQPTNECCGGCYGCLEMQMSHSMSKQDEKINSLFEAIRHGDVTHQEWLKKAIQDHFAGNKVEHQK